MCEETVYVLRSHSASRVHGPLLDNIPPLLQTLFNTIDRNVRRVSATISYNYAAAIGSFSHFPQSIRRRAGRTGYAAFARLRPSCHPARYTLRHTSPEAPSHFATLVTMHHSTGSSPCLALRAPRRRYRGAYIT